MQNRTILVTGGAGYIGSHVCYYLRQQGWLPVCFDNFSTGHRWAVKYGPLVEGDLLDSGTVLAAMQQYKPLAVVHLASFIEVAESVRDPLKYYSNNITGMLNVLQAMRTAQVAFIIFSSTAAVYGQPQYTLLDEQHPCQPINPYGHSKWMLEQILKDCGAYNIRAISLRYFNAAGAAPSEGLREAHEPESHLIPLVVRAAKQKTTLKIFGSDYATPDGTCVRDYIHVMDLADAHVRALEFLQEGATTQAVNLGSGKGTTNLELLHTLEKVCKVKLEFEFAARRAGDPAVLVSSYAKAQELLGWKPTRSLEQILFDAWE